LIDIIVERRILLQLLSSNSDACYCLRHEVIVLATMPVDE